MIFLTVGSQMAFDRLVTAVDQWAARHPQHKVVAQIGNSPLRPAHLECTAAMQPQEFQRMVQAADLVVGHAGMGTVLTALEFGKPMVLLPRRGDLQETRNDHQIATLNWLRGRPGVHAAFDEQALHVLLDQWVARGLPGPEEGAAQAGGGAAPAPLVQALAHFIATD